MNKARYLVTIIPVFLLLDSCRNPRNLTAIQKAPALKESFKDDFLIGTAINEYQILEKDPKSAKILSEQFNAVTPENAMKAEEIHPEWNVYHFDVADKLISYAKRNKMKVTGHTLVWHSQLPAFVHRMKSADSVRMFFNSHIQTVASRYRGKIDSWDVVNEALNEDGSMRTSIFYEKLGEDYVTDAFRLAQKFTPEARLYYNDYNIEQPAKRAGAIRLIKKIQAAGVRIDGVGIQGHWNIDNLPLKNIEDAISEFSALGLEVAFTELDISVLPTPFKSNEADVGKKARYAATLNPYTAGLPDSVQKKLADSYEKVFRIFLKHRDKISRVTVWGVADGVSWLNNWPIPGRTNYPLLFDREFAPKPAFYRLINLKKKNSSNILSDNNHAQFKQ